MTEEFEITELWYSTNFTAELGWRLEPSSGDLLISKVNATNRYGTANDPTYKFDFYYRSNGTRQIIAGPEMDLRGYTNPKLKFDVSHCVYVQFSPSNDRLEVVYTTDIGTTWLTGSPALYNKAGSVLATRALDYNPFTPSLASEWRRETVDLSQLAGMSGIRLGFRGVSNNGNNAFIDNIYIYEGGATHSQTVTAYNTQWQYFGTTGIGIRFSTGNSLDVNLTVDKINSNPGGTLPPGDLTNLGKIYWSVTVNSGTADGTYSFSVDYSNYPGVNNKNTVHLLKRDNETAEWVDLGTPDFVGIGSSTEWMWFGLTGFSEFAIAGGESDNPLPVELANFTAKARNRTVILNWETKTEVDNSGFEVQRIDGEGDWKKISFIEGHGTTNSTKYYSFEDTKLPAGKHSYRLKQIDNDGTSSYSDVVEVTIDLPKEFALSQNYPNPFNPSTKVDYQLAADSRVMIELYSISGEKVAVLVNQEQEAGYYTMMIDTHTHRMSSGIYIYRMTATDATGKSFVIAKKLALMK